MFVEIGLLMWWTDNSFCRSLELSPLPLFFFFFCVCVWGGGGCCFIVVVVVFPVQCLGTELLTDAYNKFTTSAQWCGEE